MKQGSAKCVGPYPATEKGLPVMRGTILSVTPTTVVYLPMSCTLCGKGHETFILDRARFERWQAGDFIQVAFPGLSAEDREVIKTKLL